MSELSENERERLQNMERWFEENKADLQDVVRAKRAGGLLIKSIIVLAGLITACLTAWAGISGLISQAR